MITRYMIILTLLILIISDTYGQVVKNYKGVYENGNANYQYFENDNYERIYHGKFEYSRTKNIEQENITINGYFKNNLKDSIWKYTITSKNTSISKNGTIETVSGYYKFGKQTGNWIIEVKDFVTKKVLKFSKVNFQNGFLIGTFEYANYLPVSINGFNSISVKGEFDNRSFYNGKWIVKFNEQNISKEGICTFRNGIELFQIQRNTNTGEIIQKLTYDNNNLFLNNLDTISNISIINSKEYLCIKPSEFYVNNNISKPRYIRSLETEPITIVDDLLNFTVNYWFNDDNSNGSQIIKHDNPIFIIKYGSNNQNFEPLKKIVLNLLTNN